MLATEVTGDYIVKISEVGLAVLLESRSVSAGRGRGDSSELALHPNILAELR